MATVPIRTEYDRRQAMRLIEHRELPCTLSVVKGAPRSIEQNKLQRKWLSEAEEQGDQTAEEYRAYCKLHFGVPILRNGNEAFRLQYDATVKPLSYEQKLEIMKEPIDFPVTRLMTTKQKAQYLDEIYQFLRGRGFVLTEPKRG